ncbi:MAG: DUF881 domain-containing protein [Anaerovoracaceae bacterium]
MSKHKGIAIAGVLTFLIGFIIAIQISTTGGEDQGGLVPLAKIKGYEAQLNQVTAEKEAALTQLKELEDRMAAIEKDKSGKNDGVKSMVEENEKNKMTAGLTDVKGPGLTVTVDDPPIAEGDSGEQFSLIAFNYEYLLSVVNKLKEAGAEAISINGDRVVSTTEISLAGDNININGKATVSPYIINAIGSSSIMNSTLTIRGGIVDTMKKQGLVVDTKEKKIIEIPRYSGVISFDYATVVPAKE